MSENTVVWKQAFKERHAPVYDKRVKGHDVSISNAKSLNLSKRTNLSPRALKICLYSFARPV